MQPFAEFWRDEARELPCCFFASDEDVEGDPEAYPCFNPEAPPCEVAERLEAFLADLENARAWRIFHQVTCRFNADLQCGGAALERLTGDLDAETFADLLDRLRVLYDTLCPAAMKSSESD